MATLDLSTAVDRIRLAIGDTADTEWLSDTEINYALSSNENNEKAAIKTSAQFILARMAYSGHERLDKLEFWGDSFEKYMRFLKEVINNPSLNATGGVYVAGMLKDDVVANIQDTTIVQHKLPAFPYQDYDDSNKNLYGIESDGYDYFSNY